MLLLDLESGLDGVLVDLIQDDVRGLTVHGEVILTQLALGVGVGDLLNQNDDVRHVSDVLTVE